MAKGRIWTKEEDEYLFEKWGNTSTKNIAKKLKRSLNAVKLRAERKGLGAFHLAGDLLSVKDLLDTLGYENTQSTVDKFMEFGFPMKYVGRFRKISIEDFWKWAENNKDIISFASLEKNILGKEPSWVDEKRKVDTVNTTNKYVFWTKSQEQLLISKVKTGKYTLDQLALDFNRSEQAIRKKLNDLGYASLVKARRGQKYTKEEKQKLIEMVQQGFDYSAIARKLNRSEGGLRDKYIRLVS